MRAAHLVRFATLTSLANQLNAAAASEKHRNITVEMVHSQIDHGTIWQFLEREAGAFMGLTLLTDLDRKNIAHNWKKIKAADHEWRLFGISDANASGLHLLIAYLLKGMEQFYETQGHERGLRSAVEETRS